MCLGLNEMSLSGLKLLEDENIFVNTERKPGRIVF